MSYDVDQWKNLKHRCTLTLRLPERQSKIVSFDEAFSCTGRSQKFELNARFNAARETYFDATQTWNNWKKRRSDIIDLLLTPPGFTILKPARTPERLQEILTREMSMTTRTIQELHEAETKLTDAIEWGLHYHTVLLEVVRELSDDPSDPFPGAKIDLESPFFLDAPAGLLDLVNDAREFVQQIREDWMTPLLDQHLSAVNLRQLKAYRTRFLQQK